MAPCSVKNNGTKFNRKPWHHVQSRIVTPCPITNRGNMFNHKSCETWSITNHDNMLNHKSCNHVQYTYDVLAITAQFISTKFATFTERHSWQCECDYEALTDMWQGKTWVLSTCPNAALYTINPTWSPLVM